MFLRANARRAGLAYRGEPFQAVYAAALRDGLMIGVAAHCWNGTVLLQAPEEADRLALGGVGWSGLPVTGFAGPAEHVRRARSALKLDESETALEGNEAAYAV